SRLRQSVASPSMETTAMSSKRCFFAKPTCSISVTVKVLPSVVFTNCISALSTFSRSAPVSRVLMTTLCAPIGVVISLVTSILGGVVVSLLVHERNGNAARFGVIVVRGELDGFRNRVIERSLLAGAKGYVRERDGELGVRGNANVVSGV